MQPSIPHSTCCTAIEIDEKYIHDDTFLDSVRWGSDDILMRNEKCRVGFSLPLNLNLEIEIYVLRVKSSSSLLDFKIRYNPIIQKREQYGSFYSDYFRTIGQNTGSEA